MAYHLVETRQRAIQSRAGGRATTRGVFRIWPHHHRLARQDLQSYREIRNSWQLAVRDLLFSVLHNLPTANCFFASIIQPSIIHPPISVTIRSLFLEANNISTLRLALACR